MIKGIIFDLDGTLVETENIATSCWGLACEDYGIPFKKKMFLSIKGTSRALAKEIFRKAYGDHPSYEELKDKRDFYFEKYVKSNGIVACPGVKKFVEYVNEKGYKTIVATSSLKEHTDEVLISSGLQELLTNRIYGNEVTKGKPDPEIFLKAVDKMGLKKEECLVIEDSKNGILSAHNGGIKAVGIPNSYKFDEETKAMCYKVVDRMDELIGVI